MCEFSGKKLSEATVDKCVNNCSIPKFSFEETTKTPLFFLILFLISALDMTFIIFLFSISGNFFRKLSGSLSSNIIAISQALISSTVFSIPSLSKSSLPAQYPAVSISVKRNPPTTSCASIESLVVPF